LAHGIAKEVKWKDDGGLEEPSLPSWIGKLTRRNNSRRHIRLEGEVVKDSLAGGPGLRRKVGRWRRCFPLLDLFVFEPRTALDLWEVTTFSPSLVFLIEG
jgi:hypothetical protein